MVENGKFFMEKVNIVKNFVDLLTKSIITRKFVWCKGKMGLVSLLD